VLYQLSYTPLPEKIAGLKPVDLFSSYGSLGGPRYFELVTFRPHHSLFR
jgi:hypothetical protein